MDDRYRNAGPLQSDGPSADAKAVTLCADDQDYMGHLKKLQEYLDQDVLKAALSAMASVTEILTVMSASSYNGKTPF